MRRRNGINPWVREPNPPKTPVPVYAIGDRVESKDGSQGSVVDTGKHHDGSQVLVIRWDRDPELTELFAANVERIAAKERA